MANNHRTVSLYILCFMILQLVAPTLVYAQEASGPTPPSGLRKFAKDNNAKLHDLGKRHGLQGWAIEINGRIQMAYTSPEGGTVFGILISPDGKIESNNQLRAIRGKLSDVVAGPENEKKAQELLMNTEKNRIATEEAKKKEDRGKSKAEQFYADIEASNWFALGKQDAPYIYVLMNPTCVHCLEYWEKVKPTVDAGSLQVRIIPFGRSPDNRVSSAALLSNADPAEAWKQFTQGNQHVIGADNVVDGAYDKVDINSALWINWKLPTPPFTAYRSPNDGKIKVIAGKPENFLLLLSEFVN